MAFLEKKLISHLVFRSEFDSHTSRLIGALQGLTVKLCVDLILQSPMPGAYEPVVAAHLKV